MVFKKILAALQARSAKAKAAHIKDLVRYLRAAKDGEKLLFAFAFGFVSDEPAAQEAEMIALASESVRSKMPVTHYLLSLREGEMPTLEQMQEACEVLLAELGLTGHQVIAAAHQDTSNIHLHVAVNRVHPESGKVIEAARGWDIEAGHRAIARIERMQGWQPEANSRYTCDQLGNVTRNRRTAPAEEPAAEPGTRARDMEAWTGQKSAQRIAQEVATPLIAGAASWGELHASLAEQGMRYARDKSGAVLFVGDVAIKASSLKDRACRLVALQKRLGAFEPADPALQVRERPIEPVKAVNRSAKRKALWTDYTAARKADKAQRDAARDEIKRRHAEQRRAVLDEHRRLRTQRLSGDWSGKGAARNAVASLSAAEKARALAELRDAQAAERRSRKAAQFPSFETWLAVKDSPDAAEAWRYREAEGLARLVGDRFDEPRPLDIRDLVATVEGRTVRYGTAAGTAFVARGRELSMIREDRAATLAALQLAVSKWGRAQITGGPAFRRLCVEIAAEHGIRLANADLQSEVEALRRARREATPAELAAEIASGAAPVGHELLAFGEAPFEHREDARASFYVTVRVADGTERTLWGVALKDAIAESKAQIGDRIQIDHKGRTEITLPDGTQTHRNDWSVRLCEEQASQKERNVVDHTRKARQVPPPAARHRLRRLSELDVVQLAERSEMLLPRDVSRGVEHVGANQDPELRRHRAPALSAHAAAREAWIQEQRRMQQQSQEDEARRRQRTAEEHAAHDAPSTPSGP